MAITGEEHKHAWSRGFIDLVVSGLAERIAGREDWKDLVDCLAVAKASLWRACAMAMPADLRHGKWQDRYPHGDELADSIGGLALMIQGAIDRTYDRRIVATPIEQPSAPPPGAFTRLEDLEREAIRLALQRSGSDWGSAAAELGVSRRTFVRKLRKHWKALHPAAEAAPSLQMPPDVLVSLDRLLDVPLAGEDLAQWDEVRRRHIEFRDRLREGRETGGAAHAAR